MTTYYEIPAFIRRAEEDQEGDANAVRYYSEGYADSMVNIGFPYSYITFFMNDGTYKTLLNNGRLQNFPTDLEESIKEYYEYVSKRASDNNAMIDNLSLNYFVGYHPMCSVMWSVT